MVVRHCVAVPSISVEVEVAVDGVGPATADVLASPSVAVSHLEVSVHRGIADDVAARAERVCRSLGVLGLQITVDGDTQDPRAGRVIELEGALHRDVDPSIGTPNPRRRRRSGSKSPPWAFELSSWARSPPPSPRWSDRPNRLGRANEPAVAASYCAAASYEAAEDRDGCPGSLGPSVGFCT